MVKIRLTRLGRKKRPFYRVVAINSRSARDGKFLDILGTYDPLQEPSVVNLDKEKIDQWISKGAQLSNRVLKLYDPEKYGQIVSTKPKRKPKKQVDEPPQASAPAEEATPTEEAAPAEEATPAEEAAPAEEATPAEDEPKEK